MPSLDELEAGLARLTTTYKNLPITFTYYPDRVGINLQRAIASVTRPPYDMGPIADQLATIVESWDLTRHGEPIPITDEGIGSLPMALASAIGREIMEDFNDPKSPVTTGSPIASSIDSPLGSRAPSSATAPTGPTSSSAPNGPGSIQPSWSGSPIPVGTTSGSAGSGS